MNLLSCQNSSFQEGNKPIPRLMFALSQILFLVTFGDKDTKILSNLCLHFARQDGQDRKKGRENNVAKVTKIPKTKIRKYVMNKTVNCVKIFYARL